MKKLFEFWTWGDTIGTLVTLIATAFLIIVMVATVKEKRVVGYSLGQEINYITITKQVDWAVDDEIRLDRSITIQEAIHLIDSLNKTINYVKR